ncbi:hypothetical protein ERO13_D10G226866v2 [Gossypium hirsutum]|uniref:DC1 domain-containing protein n=3 Tax=Gossypium TaxID=3633 RepID=A0A1U8MND1_GOSHI|nr:uncharacterized protein LOC107939514 [Gossypium hirsutum]KAG4127628.1 hypothetical protein ERO13_D10G226866v2 [Gossypium hirsutum]TYG51679.1 hypothetical protein ES288_D10G279100v1 [Gossypium darwinii]TYI62691.1 hypothetical protein E1A91_D10G264800v1 [Gossypium mustelinum]
MPGLDKQKDNKHLHDLERRSREGLFICNGCKEIGFGNCYKCPWVWFCDYVLHVGCISEGRTPLSNSLFKNCEFQFYQTNPSTVAPACHICALDIQGRMYRCSKGKYSLHPYCATLQTTFSLRDSDMKIKLRRGTKLNFFKSKCLKCDRKNRSSNDVQCLSYVSSDGNLCYHVACMKEACRDNWNKGYFRPGSETNEQSKFLALQNLAPKEVLSSVGQTSEVSLITFLKLVVYAILGEPFDLIAPLFQFSQN